MPSDCLNCGEPLNGSFCAHCGQRVEDRRVALHALLGDFFSEFFAVDGRNVRTFLALLVPGKLTNLYLAGKRASHAPPVRVYFVASLLFFLLVGFPPLDASKYNVRVRGMLVGKAEADPGLKYLDIGIPRGPASTETKLSELREMEPQVFLDGFFGGLERTVPSALILFVPLLAFALKLLYLRLPYFYVDHLVFAIHFQSFLFLALVLARFANSAGIDRLWPGLVTYVGAFFLVSPVYMYLALRRVYRQSWPRTGLKWAAVGLLYLLLIQPVVGITIYRVLNAM